MIVPGNGRRSGDLLINTLAALFYAGILLAVFSPAVAVATTVGETDPSVLFLPSGSTVSPGAWDYDGKVGRSIVSGAEKSIRSLSSYRCQVATFYHSRLEASGSRSDEKMILSVKFPGQIRVDLIHPRKGAWLLFRQKENAVRIKPFSFLPMVLDLSPQNSLITSRFGHTIDHADYRSFDHRVLAPACLLGGCVYLGKGTVLGHTVSIVNVAPVFGIVRPVFGRMWVAIDENTHLPISISTMDSHGRFMERIIYTHCQENISFPKGFFSG